MTRHDPRAWRGRFPILDETVYLVNHSLGAMPSAVYEKLEAFADQWATRGVRAWAEGWWETPLAVGELVGRLMNAPAGTVSMHQNVSIVQGLVASAVEFDGTRNKVVYTDQNFPTNMYVWEGQRGARVEVVPSDADGRVPTERLLAAIDEETFLVPISHVTFRGAWLQDAAAICARAREVGALVLLDTYQSLGALPVDVQALGVDMACGGSVKWLLGGPGAAYLYVREGLIDELQPRATGWAGHEQPFAFEPGPQRYARGAVGWQHGTPHVATLMQASAGYETLLEVGVDAIRGWSLHLQERLRDQLVAAGFELFGPGPSDPRGGTLTVAVPEWADGAAWVASLEARGVLVDHRPAAGIRVSPHFYTLEEELDTFVEALDEVRHEDCSRGSKGGR